MKPLINYLIFNRVGTSCIEEIEEYTPFNEHVLFEVENTISDKIFFYLEVIERIASAPTPV